MHTLGAWGALGLNAGCLDGSLVAGCWLAGCWLAGWRAGWGPQILGLHQVEGNSTFQGGPQQPTCKLQGYKTTTFKAVSWILTGSQGFARL